MNALKWCNIMRCGRIIGRYDKDSLLTCPPIFTLCSPESVSNTVSSMTQMTISLTSAPTMKPHPIPPRPIADGGDHVSSYLCAMTTPVPTLPENINPASTTERRMMPLQFLIVPRGIPGRFIHKNLAKGGTPVRADGP